MYAGMIRHGGYPFSMNGYPQSEGYGGRYLGAAPYSPLGNIFDDIQKIAGKVGLVSGELSQVAGGQATVATVPTGYASLTIPVPGSPVSKAIPLWVIGVGAAGLLYLAFRPRR